MMGDTLSKRARVSSPSSQEDLSPNHGDDPHPHHGDTIARLGWICKLANLEVTGIHKAHHSVSSSSTHHYGSSSHQEDDDDNEGISRASTPSPTTYLNFLSPLNYEKYDSPTSSQQDDDLLFERQTALLNQTQKMHDELRGGFKSFRKALKGVFSKKKK
ncbi:hypothetical protein Tco_0511202 [Tanacetum coccineum]